MLSPWLETTYRENMSCFPVPEYDCHLNILAMKHDAQTVGRYLRTRDQRIGSSGPAASQQRGHTLQPMIIFIIGMEGTSAAELAVNAVYALKSKAKFQ